MGIEEEMGGIMKGITATAKRGLGYLTLAFIVVVFTVGMGIVLVEILKIP